MHADDLFENVTWSKWVYLIGQDRDNAHLYPTLLFFLLRLKFDNDVMIKLGRACICGMDLVYAATNGRMGTKWKWLPKQNAGQACRWGFKLFICERRLREYKSTLIDKGLNYFISVKLLILETIVSQHPWLVSCLIRCLLYDCFLLLLIKTIFFHSYKIAQHTNDDLCFIDWNSWHRFNTRFFPVAGRQRVAASPLFLFFTRGW